MNMFKPICSYNFTRRQIGYLYEYCCFDRVVLGPLLGCMQESGNPAVDDLRERVAELAGINLVDFLEEGKGSGNGGQAQAGKGKGKVG